MPKQTFRNFQYLFALLALCGIAAFSFPAALFSQIPALKSEIPVSQAQTEMTEVSFEENRGQFDKQVRFMARAAGANIFLTADEAVYVLPAKASLKSKVPGLKSEEEDPKFKIQNPKSKIAFALRMKIVGANLESAFAGENLREQRTNYFKGDESNWRAGIRNFGAVRYENVYDGIGIIWYGMQNGATRYDFVVAPNADPQQIELEFNGADAVETDSEGNLLIHTPAGTIRQNKPYTYQETDNLQKIEIESGFRVEGNCVKFSLGAYDRMKKLVIDPTVTLNNLAFSTFLGSFGDDTANDIAVDAGGNTYITGKTLSPSFPTTAGTFDTSANGQEDVFVTKINASGTGVIFSTFLGGSFYDEGYGIAVDSGGNIFVAGTASSGFPTTGGAYDTSFNGGADVFVAKLNSLGSALVYSTYIGASNIDYANDLAIDAGGSAYIVVRTSDAVVDYPTTAGAFDTSFNGFDDVAVTKLNDTGTTLLYSTFLGGSSIDNGKAIAVNANGEVFVAGSTTDDVTDFPTTAGAYDTTLNGLTDFFVTKLNAGGSGLVYSTVVGGAGIDNGNSLAIDSAGNAYVTGIVSIGFPTTAGVFDTTAAGSSEIGVSKLSANGATLVYSTFLGGTQGETANSVAVDNFGFAYITGNNFGGDYPTTVSAYDTSFNGGSDAILTVLNQSATGLVYSTYLGGGANDTANNIALDEIGNVYLAGQTVLSTTAFPTTPQAFQNLNGGGTDAFISKFGNYAISGRVIDTGGNPLASVLVAMSGQTSGFMLTGADGRFGFTNTAAYQPHTVSATRSGYSINPALFNIANLDNNRELIFVGTVGSPTGGAGGNLRFENISYSKTENGGEIKVTVNRTGTITTGEPVTVDFATVGGSAVAGLDFVPTSGVLTFMGLETTKTISIPLVNDGALEPRENFSLVLSNPTNNAEIETNRGATVVQVLDEDLAGGDLLISEFRQRGRLGANDEYVKIFNPNDFDVTISAADGSNGLTLAHAKGETITPVATIPNLVTVPARGHYLLTNNNPSGGFSLIDYPTGRGTTISVGDQTFSADIPDNANLVLLNTANALNFSPLNLVDAVGFENSVWTEGKSLPAIGAENSETCFVRKLTPDGLQDTGSNAADFLLIDNRARIFAGNGKTKILSILGAPAPETSESLRLMSSGEISVEETGSAIYDPTPVPNGAQGTLTIYRRLTNKTNQPILALRLRAADFPTVGNPLLRKTSSRPDFRLLSSTDDDSNIKGLTLAAENLQPNGGGLNSTLTISSITANTPLLPDESIVVAVKFGVMRYGRYSFKAAVEALQ